MIANGKGKISVQHSSFEIENVGPKRNKKASKLQIKLGRLHVFSVIIGHPCGNVQYVVVGLKFEIKNQKALILSYFMFNNT